MNLGVVIMTPIMFDNGSTDPKVLAHRSAVEQLIEAGCRNWAVDIDRELFSTTKRVLPALQALPGRVNWKIPQDAYNQFMSFNYSDWAEYAEFLKTLGGGKIEAGVEVSTKSWGYTYQEFYSVVSDYLCSIAIQAGLEPICFNDTIAGDSVNKSKEDWHATYDFYRKTCNYKPEEGIHLYRGTLKMDWPEVYQPVRDHIYESGYPRDKKIHITECGFDVTVKTGKCLFKRKQVDEQAQADAWENLLEFAATEESIGEVWAFCAWDAKYPDKHPIFNADGTPRKALAVLKKYY
jgi:hypothetical protein